MRSELEKYKKIAIINSGGSSLRYSGDKIHEHHQPAYNEKDWEEFDN